MRCFQRTRCDLRYTGLTADSREVQPGFLFAALPGSKADGPFLLTRKQRALLPPLFRRTMHLMWRDLRLYAVTTRVACWHWLQRVFMVSSPIRLLPSRVPMAKLPFRFLCGRFGQKWGFARRALAPLALLGQTVLRTFRTRRLTLWTCIRSLHDLLKTDVQHLAIEASSHGLVQNRLDGLRLAAGAFTNLTRDHLDYHKTFEAYFDAKLMLFERLLPAGAACCHQCGHS